MGKYFNHNVNKDNKNKDLLLKVLIAIVAVVFAIAILYGAYGIHITRQYQIFEQDYTTSLNHARRNGGLTVHRDGDSWRLSNETGSQIYTQIIDAGPGKPQKSEPKEDMIHLSFPDGSEMKLCRVEIMEEARLQDQGIFISFKNKAGKVYMYDTDRIDVDLFMRWFNKPE